MLLALAFLIIIGFVILNICAVNVQPLGWVLIDFGVVCALGYVIWFAMH